MSDFDDLAGTDDFDPGVVSGDLDGDGYDESIAVDADGDGLLDTFGIDLDADGIADVVGLDLDGDGVIDAEAVDLDGDGVIDEILVASTGVPAEPVPLVGPPLADGPIDLGVPPDPAPVPAFDQYGTPSWETALAIGERHAQAWDPFNGTAIASTLRPWDISDIPIDPAHVSPGANPLMGADTPLGNQNQRYYFENQANL